MLSLTATELPRFMACNGFTRLGGINPFNPSTEVTDEGNAAHWLCEQVYHGANPDDLIGQKAFNGLFITDEMVENCRMYIQLIQMGNCIVEKDTSYRNDDKWEIRGRADCIVTFPDEHTLMIADLKYGWRIVEPEMNWTLISHAIDFRQCCGFNPTKIVFRIYQPRPFHPQGPMRDWVITNFELDELEKQLKATLDNPSATVCSGSQCYKCKSLSQCPAAQIASMNAVDVANVAFDSEMTDDKLAWMLDNLKRASEVIKQSYEAYQDLALHRLKGGKKVKGYSIQNAVGNTTWNDDITPELVEAMCNDKLSVKKLITPAQARKKGVPEELLAKCTHRPDNGFKLVRVDEDKLGNKLFGDK